MSNSKRDKSQLRYEAGTPKLTDGGGFVPSDTIQMARPSFVDRIALIASNLNYRREAPRANRLFLRGYSPRLNLRLREEEEDVENIQNRKAISTLHSAAATPRAPSLNPRYIALFGVVKKFASPSLDEIENGSFFHSGTIHK